MNPATPLYPSEGLPSGPLRWHEGLLLLVAFFLPSLMTWLYFDTFAGQSGWVVGLYTFGKIVMALIGLIPLLLVRRTTGKWPQFPVRSLRGLAWGALFGLATVVGLLTLYYTHLKGSPSLATAPDTIGQKLREIGVASPWHFLAMAVFLSVLHAAFEEYYWRWFVFGELRRAMPWVVALLLANLGFTLHLIIVIHIYVPSWTMTLLCSLGVFVGGSVWGWIYQKSGSLVGPWVSHMLIDFVLMWIGYDLCRGMLS